MDRHDRKPKKDRTDKPDPDLLTHIQSQARFFSLQYPLAFNRSKEVISFLIQLNRTKEGIGGNSNAFPSRNS